LELGFSTFFLNRTNRSGIISGGIIGGKDQNSKYKIDCRFNKKKLIKRIKKIGTYSNKITLHNKDAYELINELKDSNISSKNSLFYLDPPYYKKGSSLYVNYYKHDDHEKIRDLIKTMEDYNWIISYDNSSEIRDLYKNFNSLEYSLTHSANNSKTGREVLFYNDLIKLPDVDKVTNVEV
jgi:DNA adenine methylase